MSLRDELAEAEATAQHLRNRIAAEGCAAAGHDWKFIGGRNAGCEMEPFCDCSVPVHVCLVCGDSDYGDNAEADEIRHNCREGRS